MRTRLTQFKDRLNGHYDASVGCAIAALTLWQLVIATFGVDLCDTGYYLTFFDNIFAHPQAVEYNFMYYLSGLAGGVLNALLPACGKWLAMRVAGVLCCTGAMAIVAWALRRVVPATSVILGNLMVVASLVAFPYTFNNDLMSALLWVTALAFMFKGITAGKTRHLLLAGLVVGINIFTRIPNVLAVALAAMPLVARLHYRHRSWRECLSQGGVVLCGAAVGALAVIDLMMALGHWGIFKQNMADLVAVATGSSGMASHNAGGLVMAMLDFYRQCMWVGLKLAGLVLMMLCAGRLKWRSAKLPAWAIITAATIYFMWHQSHVLHPLWVMTVAASIVIIFRYSPRRAVAAWLGLAMLLMFPLGSDGATNNGGIIAWMAAPVACAVWQRRSLVMFPLAFVAVAMSQTVTVGAYFDGGALWRKTAAIHAPCAACIHTTPDRAHIINCTIDGLKPHVTAGDTLLCYGSIPMMNHLTGTVPALGCSWPELLSARELETRLNAMPGTHAILRQKFNDLGPYWSEASDDYLLAYPMQDDKFLIQSKMDALNRFVGAHGYRMVWQNEWFALFVAGDGRENTR